MTRIYHSFGDMIGQTIRTANVGGSDARSNARPKGFGDAGRSKKGGKNVSASKSTDATSVFISAASDGKDGKPSFLLKIQWNWWRSSLPLVIKLFYRFLISNSEKTNSLSDEARRTLMNSSVKEFMGLLEEHLKAIPEGVYSSSYALYCSSEENAESGGFQLEDTIATNADRSIIVSAEASDATRFGMEANYLLWNVRLCKILECIPDYIRDVVRREVPEGSEGSIEKVPLESFRPFLNELSDELSKLTENLPNVDDRGYSFWGIQRMARSRYGILGDRDDDIYCSAEDISAAADGESLTYELNLPIEWSSEVDIQAAGEPNNKIPFEGTLFYIDQPSEAVPAIGPGLPLFVPMSVAVQALDTVSGLPLDAADNLSGHANKEITGVINSAQIQGSKFLVQGSLFGWSQPDKVAKISANSKDLGMSMNASATGRRAKVGNTEVFHIDTLDLHGANILFADKATYKQTTTKVLAMAQDPLTKSQQLAASAITDKPQEEDSMGTEELAVIENQIQALAEAQTQGYNALSEAMIQMAETISLQASDLQVIMAERKERERQEEVAAQQKAVYDQQELIQASVQAALANLLNPSNSPVRKTGGAIPISAASGQAAVPSIDQDARTLEVEIAAKSATLETLRHTNQEPQRRMLLIEEIAALKRRLQSLGAFVA